MDTLLIPKTYGFFEVGNKTFTGAKCANKCLLYDTVSSDKDNILLLKRYSHPTLVGILQTTGPKYGFTSRQHPIYLCKPLDSRYPPFYVGSKIVDILSNKLITFQFSIWEKEFPQGTFLELLGDCGDSEAEKKANLLNASPYKWMKTLPEIVTPNFEARMKISGYTFNIDPDGCRDVDDCITIVDNCLIISIADVSAWVEANPWMKFAEHIGTSLYSSGTCVKPMFPRELSENKLSLLVGEERLAYSLIIGIHDDTISYEFKETVVKVDKSYTYDTIHSSDTNAIKNMVKQISGVETDDSHKWVEILMLKYNEKAGELLKQKNSGILRCQKGINEERAKLFEQFGSEYMYLCYESAKYCLPSEDTSHNQLKLQNYAHASSPIRRYVDIINQFALKNKVLEYSILERFNDIQKKAKNFERNLLYIDLIQNKRMINAVVLDSETIFIPYLKKVYYLKNSKSTKENISLRYYINAQNSAWKDKIIFEIV